MVVARRWYATAIAIGALGCGDNTPVTIGPALQPAASLFVIAHFDDDLIFMQPEIQDAVGSGSVTTVYVTSGDPVHGDVRALLTFEAAMTAYQSVAGSSDWDCGYLLVGDSPIHHCRLRDRPVSMIGLDIPDGGIEGDATDSTLHLAEGVVASLPIRGPIGGRATVATIVDTLTEILTTTAPSEIHALDLAATHGRDHSSHLFSSSFAFWAAARTGYGGAIRWHRGYNVETEAITLDGAAFAAVEPMLGYFEACYFGCGPCGSSCATLDVSHDAWLHRQYSSTRIVDPAMGPLASDDAPTLCVAVTADGVRLADCAGATSLQLAPDGHLTSGTLCLASPTAITDAVVAAPCADVPAQYWLLDSEGVVWNGSPPDPTTDMAYDHVRCLSSDAQAGTLLAAPICGSRSHPHWHFGE